MKSMVLTGIRKMEMQERPAPAILRDTEVLIKMKVVSVCGSDVHYYVSGRIGDQVVDYPFPVGHESAGEVTAIGKKVSRVKPGQRIAIEPAMPCFKCDQCLAGRHHTCRNLKFLGCPGQAEGSLSEYIVMPETSCYPIPDHMTYDQAAISEPLAIGIYAVRLSQMDLKGKNIGIFGFGPIGMSVMLAAMHRGADNFYVTDKQDTRLIIARDTGAIWMGNPDKMDVETGIREAVPDLLDIVFECCGQQEAVDNAVELLKPGGKLMIIGIPEFNRWSLKVDLCRRKELSIQNVRRQNHAVEETLELLSSGAVDIGRMPTHRFKFPDAKAAFDLVAGYKDGVMKAMIDFD